MKLFTRFSTAILYLTFISILQTACINSWNESGYRIIENDSSLTANKSSIKGTVVWKANKAGIGNLKVLLCRYIYASDDFLNGNTSSCMGKIAETFTDKDGIFRIDNIDPGTYAYAVEDPNLSGTVYKFLVKGDSNDIFQSRKGYAVEIRINANQTIEIKPFEF